MVEDTLQQCDVSARLISVVPESFPEGMRTN